MIRRAITLMFLAACSGPKPAAQVATVAVTMPTAVPTPVPQGEQTQPLRIRTGTALDPGAGPPPIFEHELPAAITGNPAAWDNGTAYYYANGTLVAFDLHRARVNWSKDISAVPGNIAAGPDGVAVLDQRMPALRYLDVRTGAPRYSFDNSKPAGAIGGVLFAENFENQAYFAFDARSGRTLWKTFGGGQNVMGAPVVRDGVLLQPFENSGAILEGVLYGFDARTGAAKWLTLSAASALGYRDGIAYVDSTWFPSQMGNYVPMTIAAISIRTGKNLDAYTYAPDPLQNAATYRNSMPIKAYVSGAYVYLKVNGTWYRYDRDREPAQAHASRLPDLQIEATFEDGSLLVTRADGAFIAKTNSLGDLVLHRFAGGSLQSSFVNAQDGTTYAVIGQGLYRFDRDGAPHAIGSVTRCGPNTILPWPGNVAVMCAARELRFRDATIAPPPLTVAAVSAPAHRLVLHAFDIPPAQGFMHQWFVGPVAPWQGDGVVMVLGRGDLAKAGAIAYVSRSGRLRTVATAKDLPPPVPGSIAYPTQPRSEWPPNPNAVLYDRNGDVWFNNSVWPPLIYKLDSSGGLTSELVGEESKDAWRRGAIRLTLGPDGQAWFARSHPTPEIARADGTRVIPIPPRYGNPLVIAPAPDGFWFLSQTQLVHVSTPGSFTGTPLPEQIRNIRGYPGLHLRSAGRYVWVANGAYIARMNEHGVLAHYALPDATLSVNTMITACDGSLYLAENAPEVLRLPPGGSAFERYSIDYRQIDGFARTADCTIWFVEGSNMPRQHVGTLELH